MANANPLMYKKHDGNTIGLTQKGFQQAQNVGIELRKYINADEKTIVWHGPSLRIIQTAYRALDYIGEHVDSIRRHMALREMDLGLFHGATKEELETTLKPAGDYYEEVKLAQGLYHTPTPMGEAPSDVHENLLPLYQQIDEEAGDNDNVVIFSSGISLRVIAKHYLNLTPEEYALLNNPDNGSIKVLQQDTTGTWVDQGYI